MPNNNKNTCGKLGDDYKLLIELGSGTFGSVWRIIEKKTNKEYAMKIEEKGDKCRLKNEYKIYKKLEKSGINFGIPKSKRYFETSKKCYLVMQLMGKSLDQILNDNQNAFDLATVLRLGVQIISLLQSVHNAGFIHRDIKPNNFLIGTGEDIDSVFIMDFGLSKKYLNDDDEHIPMKTDKSLVGTARYASINVHQGFESSRRDDMEAVGYMLVYLLGKKLPWQGLKKKAGVDNMTLIGNCKMKTSLKDLCGDLPECFGEYITYCRNLKFDETPDYKYLKKLFKNTGKEQNIKLKFYWQ